MQILRARSIIKFIKKYPPLLHFVRFFYQLYSSFKFPIYILFDPESIRTKWYRKIKNMQLNKNKPLFLDRQSEIKEFFNINNLYLLKHYIKYGFPNTGRFKRHYLQAFKGRTNLNKLKKAYDSVSFNYTLRLMLTYERYSMITGYLDFMVKNSGKNLGEFKVLDYGCGVSDIGLLFCSYTAMVTICDLDNKRFNFLVWRFKKRGFNPETIRVKDTEIYPKLPRLKFDLIIATELFEHVRNPLKLLKNFTESLKSGGYLFDSMGGNFERDSRPLDHLKEAFEIGQSKKYVDFYNKHYIHLFPKKELRYLFKKR